MQKIQKFAIIAMILCAPLIARAESAQELYDSMIGNACAQCHGTGGQSNDNLLAPLKGMDRNHLIASMKNYRDNKTDATVMHQLAKGFNDSQLESLANFFNKK